MSFCASLERLSVSLSDPAHSKKKAFETLSKLLEKESGVSSRIIFEQLLEREKIGSTGLGRGVALPHCRIAEIDQPWMCLLRTRVGIDYDAPDDLPVSLFFALLIPEKNNDEYLQLVAKLARKLDRQECISRLGKASDADQVIKILED